MLIRIISATGIGIIVLLTIALVIATATGDFYSLHLLRLPRVIFELEVAILIFAVFLRIYLQLSEKRNKSFLSKNWRFPESSLEN